MKPTTVRRILVAVDFSSCSRAALELACSMGAALGATLEVMFVHNPGGDEDFGKEELAAAKEELHRFVGTVHPDSALSVGERIEVGDARERIVSIADSDGFDLIVLGTHGRTGRPRMLAGSVAESVVRTASRPVVTVREP